MIIDLDLITVGVGLLLYSFVQGIGYAIANYYTEKHLLSRIRILENRVRGVSE